MILTIGKDINSRTRAVVESIVMAINKRLLIIKPQ